MDKQINPSLPNQIEAVGCIWHKQRVLQSHWLATTGLYADANGKEIVLKLYRQTPYRGFPMRWFSQLQARHEEKLFAALESEDFIPKCLGRYKNTGIIHEYIPGRPLQRGEQLDPIFFDELEKAFGTMHRKGIAFVDTDKRDNILVATSGKPCLFDFQLSWKQAFFPFNVLTWPLFLLLRGGDRYHLRKHRLKHTQGALSRAELNAMMPWYVKAVRVFTKPLRWIRHTFA